MTIDQGQDVAPSQTDRERITELERNVENLEAALQTARTIGIAMGIIMVSQKVPEEQAFKILAALSQSTNRKVRDLASQIAYSGAI